MSFQFRWSLALLALGASLLAGCSLGQMKGGPGNSSSSSKGSSSSSNSDNPARTASFTPSSDAPKDVHDAIAKLNTAYPYRLTERLSGMGNGASTIPDSTRVVEFEAADRLHMKWSRGVSGDVEAITIGDKHYWYSGGKWTGGLNQRPDGGVDLAKIVAEMIKDVKYVGPETVNGIACHLYSCTIDGSMGGQNWTGTMKIWIGAADGLPHQSDSDFKIGAFGGKSLIVYEYNINFKIEPPAM